MNGERIREHLSAFMTIFIWGLTFLSTKHLGERLSSMEILFARYLIAYVILWILKPKPLLFQGWKKEGLLFAAAMSGAAIYQFMENLSVSYTDPSSVSFITATAPLFTAILAHRFLGEPLTVRNLFGMGISIAGVFLICFGDAETLETGMLGDLIIFGSIWLWAVYSVLIKKLADYKISPLLQTRRLFFYSLSAMLPCMLLRENPAGLGVFLQKEVIWNLLFLGVFASAICFFTWNRAVEKLGATTTSKYLFVMPLITLLGQVFLRQGAVGAKALLGMAVTLLGIGVSEFEKRN